MPTPPNDTPPCAHVLTFQKHFSKDFHLLSPRHSILATSQSYIAQVTLDDRYTNKLAPLDSMVIYPKPDHNILYTPMTGEMKCPKVIPLSCAFHSISSNVDATHAPT